MRWLGRLLGLIVALALVLVGLVLFLPADRMGRIASDQLSAQMGRQVTLRDVSVSVFPNLGITAGGIEIANPDWAGNGPMIRAEGAQIGVDPMAALQRRLKVREVALIAPQVTLITDAEGRANWEFGASSDTTLTSGGGGGSSAAAPDFSVDALTIRDGRVTFQAAAAEAIVIDGVTLTAALPQSDGPLEFDLALQALNAQLALQGSVQSPQALMNGQDSAVTLQLRAGGGTVDLNGALNTRPAVSGAMTLQTSDLPAMLTALGVQGVTLPAFAGPDLRLSGDIFADAAQVALRGAQITSGATQASGDIDAKLGGPRPVVTARLSLPVLDLSADSAGGSSGTGAEVGAGATGWSTDPIDASALGLIDGTLVLAIDDLRLPQARVGPLQARATIDNARAVLDITQLNAFGGDLTGQFIANNRSGLSVRATMSGSNLGLGPALVAFAGIDKIEGQTGFDVNLLGAGASVAAIMASLDGTLSLNAGPGVFKGMNLDGLLRGASASGGTTVFDTLTGTFAVTQGVMRGDDLTLGLPGLSGMGEGRIDLGAQSLDYLLSVNVPQARDGRGLTVPVRLKGPWSDVAIRADLQAALDANLAEEREALEQRLRDKAEEEVGNRLGVQRQEGQSLEDAVRDRVKDEAEGALKRLFGR